MSEKKSQSQDTITTDVSPSPLDVLEVFTTECHQTAFEQPVTIAETVTTQLDLGELTEPSPEPASPEPASPEPAAQIDVADEPSPVADDVALPEVEAVENTAQPETVDAAPAPPQIPADVEATVAPAVDVPVEAVKVEVADFEVVSVSQASAPVDETPASAASEPVANETPEAAEARFLAKPKSKAKVKVKAKSKSADVASDNQSVLKSIKDLEAESIPKFEELDLPRELQEAIAESGYDRPTEIQAQIIPHMLEGRDVLAQSQTGTGKTAAFALPILARLDAGTRRKPQVLVLAPTRELAIQVAKSFETYAKNIRGFSVATIYGGQDYEPQLRQLRRGAQVVVGTPGRVIDHIKRGTLDLRELECLVLDEADEMLNMGFLEDVQFVLERTPEQRQIALFSATLPPAIRDIAQQYLKNPQKITVKAKTLTADLIRQRALIVAPRDKIDVLTRILEAEETDGVIVFVKTRDATITVADDLNRAGLSAIALNGDMPQKVRERAIHQLKSGRLNILVATDVAARGLDVSRVSHVFNFDVPHDSEMYIHRVGRTGRAGRKGEAIIFLTNAQRGKLRMIEKATKQAIELVLPPTANDINAARVDRFKQQLIEIAEKQDLTMFSELISKCAEESGQPVLKLAAAIAHLGQQGRPFLMKDLPKHSKRDRRDERGGNDRFDKSADGFSKRSGGKSTRRLGAPEQGMSRYRIEVGAQDGVKPGNIVGAVANEGGIEGRSIGPIKIYDAFSTIDLPASISNEAFQTLQQTWVSGKQLKIRLDTGRGVAARSGPNGPRAEYSRGPKPQGNKRFAGKKSAHPAEHRKKRKNNAT